jgi:hypothetical protein
MSFFSKILAKLGMGGASSAPALPGGGGFGRLLGGGAQRAGSTGSLASMLDKNGDGNPLDDIMRMAGKIGR